MKLLEEALFCSFCWIVAMAIFVAIGMASDLGWANTALFAALCWAISRFGLYVSEGR